MEVGHDIRRLANRESANRLNAEFRAGLCCHCHGEDFWAEAGACADAAHAFTLKHPQPFAGEFAFGRFVEIFELGEDTLERLGRSAVRSNRHRDVSLSRAVKNKVAEIFWQISPRFFHGSGRVRKEAIEERGVVGLHALVGLLPRTNSSLCDRLLGINHKIWIEKTLCPDALACGAGAEVAVEGKMLRSEARHGEAGRGIAKIGGEFFFDPLRCSRFLSACGEVSTAQSQGSLHRVGQALAEVGTHAQAVYYCLDEVGLCFIEADVFCIRKFDDFAIDAKPDKALAAGFFNDITELASLTCDEWRKDEEL